MSTKKILLIALAAVVVLTVLIVVGKKTGFIGKGTALEVTTKKVQRLDVIETVSASGKIFPATEVKISPDVSGEIMELNFEEGDSVNEGDLVAIINPDIYQSLYNRANAALNQAKAAQATSKANLSQAQAQFDNAKLTFDRNQQLYDSKVLSQADYDNAVAAFKTAEAQLESAKQNVESARFSVNSAEAGLKEASDNLKRTKIFAPITGVISVMSVEQGERVVGTTQMPGTEMFSIADFDNLEVQVDVTENVITRVSVGDTADVDIDAYYGRTFKGIVTHIASSASGASLLTSESVTNFTVKVRLLKSSYQDLLDELHEPPFKPGMSASVEIYTDKVNGGLAVPIQAVLIEEVPGKSPLQIVYLFNDGIAKKVVVETGIQDAFNIHITKGLDEGQEIITGPYSTISRLLEDGDEVRRQDPDKKERKFGRPGE